MKVDLAFPQQGPDDLDGFLEAIDTVIKGNAEGVVLRLVPAGTDSPGSPLRLDRQLDVYGRFLPSEMRGFSDALAPGDRTRPHQAVSDA